MESKVDEIAASYTAVIEEICALNWVALSKKQLTGAAMAYWYFSIQFRESLICAYRLHPDDAQLQSLVREECETDNLSPWPDIAAAGEKMNHDEFMRRLLLIAPIDPALKAIAEAAGQRYLERTRQIDEFTRAMSIASYECGGLERVFGAILRAREWDTPALAAFRHFLVQHISFDSDPDQGHGALIQHLVPDERVRVLWVEFRDLLTAAVPCLMPRSYSLAGGESF